MLRKLKIGLVLITDSSIDGRYSKSIIQQKAERAGKVIGVSGSSKIGGLVLSRSGSATYRFEIKLVDQQQEENISSTAMNFTKSIAAITDISRNDRENVIAPFEVQFKSNIFKRYAHGSAGLSVRFNTVRELDLIEQKIKKIISQQKRSKIYQVQFEGGQRRPPMVKNKINEEFYHDIKRIAKKVDVRLTEEHRWSSSDICHVMGDHPRIDGMGPVGEYLPSGNERILRHSLLERALLLALVLSDK
jgi:D-alanine-D-alanine ligase